MSKIGLGIITCNRQDFYEACLHHVNQCTIDELITINDGRPYVDCSQSKGKYIEHETNKGVGVSKNEAIQYLLDQDCEHIFLIEDDINIKNPDGFKKIY